MSETRIRMLRKENGMSAAEASELSGTPYRTWLAWELGESNPPNVACAWLELRLALKNLVYTRESV